MKMRLNVWKISLLLIDSYFNYFYTDMAITNRNMFEKLRSIPLDIKNNTLTKTALFNFLMVMKHYENQETLDLKMKVNTFISHLCMKWKNAGRKYERFSQQNATWLDLEFYLSDEPGKHFSGMK